MFGKDRFQFESPNAIDAGEAPPSHPGRRGPRGGGRGNSGGTRSPRSVRAEDFVAKDERLFRGTKILIEGSEHSGTGPILDEENPRRCSISTTGSFEGSTMYFYDEESEPENKGHHSLPSPEEARMYAASLLRRHSDTDSEPDAIWAAQALADEEAKPLSSSAVWRRPSRRKSHQARKNAMTKDPMRKSWLYLVCTAFFSLLMVAISIAIIVALTMMSIRSGKASQQQAHGPKDVEAPQEVETPQEVESPKDVEHEMVDSPRFLQTIDWLSEHDISTMEALTTADSPQFLAAKWIADLDVENLDVPVHVETDPRLDPNLQYEMDPNAQNNNTLVAAEHEAHHRHVVYERFLQRYVLAVFFFALDGPASWTKELSFLSENHECAWYHMEVANDGEEFAVGVTCNDKMLVADIFIPGNNLKGDLPSELQSLRHLELLGLRNNHISTIPQEISNLKSTLKYLDLSKNNLDGSIPEFLGSMQELRALGLASNALSGSIPNELAKLYKLVTLDLGNNMMLTGSIKDTVGQMVNLEYLYLEVNNFEDVLDDTFLINLRHLKELSLSDNNFRSFDQLPFHLISHQNLTGLDLSDNALQGTLPPTFLSASNTNNHLKFLNLQGNRLDGTLPEAIQMLSDLEIFDVSNNQFTGSIPLAVGNLRKMTHCYLGSNDFDPNIIPPVFFTDSNLKVLSLPNTQLTGMVPPWLKMVTTLEYLDLRGNRLTGSIPSDVWKMPALSTLLVSNNILSFAFPRPFPEGSQLEILDLGGNDGVTGGTNDICMHAEKLTTFSYSCDKMNCTGSCCHSECCGPAASETCFSDIVSSSVQAKKDEVLRDYQVNRTISSFNPGMIHLHS